MPTRPSVIGFITDSWPLAGGHVARIRSLAVSLPAPYSERHPHATSMVQAQVYHTMWLPRGYQSGRLSLLKLSLVGRGVETCISKAGRQGVGKQQASFSSLVVIVLFRFMFYPLKL